MALLNLKKVTMGFGSPLLIDGADLQVESGERLCLVGRNGSGKSTLMKLISGVLLPDGGDITRAPGLKVTMLPQEVPGELNGSVFDCVTGGLGDVHRLVARYHSAVKALEGGGEKAIAELERVHHELESKGGWHANQRVEGVLSRLKLPADAEFSQLSGGYKRRALLGRALVAEPDLLLLDEPTNHLDIESINWLEEFLLGYWGTILFITHDRMLAKKLATRIIELDRGRLMNWQCGYADYLERKESLLHSEARQNALFDKKLAEEEAWVRQGIKARRTRNEGRVRALEEMRRLRVERRELEGTARIRSQEAEFSGKLVIEAKGIGFSYEGSAAGPAIKDFSTLIMRGDKIGIIGPNGSGKTTLLKLLLGKLAPASGSVRLGTRLEVAYFDQHRSVLDEERTVQENIGDGNSQIMIDGEARHVIGYLQDFLFSPDRARTPVKALSGGERNRLMLAKLFARPSNLLVMDEPTNDLDVETLDLLEDLLVEYQGTVLLVSHDRTFLNNVVTSTIVFERGDLNEYIGGYDDWLRQRPAESDAGGVKNVKKEKPKKERGAKLSFKEERELSELPERIEAIEAEEQALYKEMSDPAFYRQGVQTQASAKVRMEEIEELLKALYLRWEELEAVK
ncbi:MAG TPA: ABC transporter ATP-binding protein [Deltaproteobacteria bacterium]|nr:MAG: ABC transporter ATP-binding protein [Deltaproteobacteria bacterium GWA2_55_82]OGQ63448.1 MAG: ABC transporter ATP-binding protein [Deltaproteobacteria bacterium RIFCSPLOWO2_02_FULL_55_12]OIJ74829.1 MAG: ABC transporter ATP-binding protein [Deltaproteobacteria bacterium GWC2_55_46]HBG47525.1 ABC transporter ATP-binding protein [Deltaproteobacteria bacterium]HCY11541.1 ABC transporter ATP-binding protein [Deltaproteobacteria bacterium]